HDFRGHPAADVDVRYGHTTETLNFRFSLDEDVLGCDPAGNLADQLDRHGLFALKISAQSPFDDRGMTNHARATELALVGQMHVTTGADGATEAGSNLVLAPIDTGAATRTVGRCRLIAVRLLSFAFVTRIQAVTTPAQTILQL